ncbi:MAG: hypothetical protein JHC33_04635 [Ignisphaera sp.]|jgi:hypothetical protein|nr:hypothetical protein [Ignisphaera sp.]
MTEEEYIKNLMELDWFYEYSDDPQVWLKNNNIRKQLNDASKYLDSNHAIYHQYCLNYRLEMSKPSNV